MWLDLLYANMAYLPRVYVALRILSVLGENTIPASVLNGYGLALIFLLPAPGLPPGVEAISGAQFVLFAIKEAAIGFLLGFLFSLVFALAEAAGQFIDHQSGLTFSQNVDPVNGNQTSPTATLLHQLSFMVFWSTGGMLIFLDVLFDSFRFWPPLQPAPDLVLRLGWLAGDWMDNWFAMALMAAAACIICLLLVDFGLGLLGRAAPNINLGQITFTFKGLIVPAVLVLSLTTFADTLSQVLQSTAAAVRAVGGAATGR